MTLADGYDCFLLDLDGVLYRGNAAVPGAPETLALLRGWGKRIAFLTNNSSSTPQEVATKLGGLGIAAEPGEVVTSALATADRVAAMGARTAFVVGERGVREALTEAGVEILSEGRVDVVVVGLDRSADYGKLRAACMQVQRGARLVATNADAAYPAADGLWPGAGALLAVITTTTGAEAEVVGKPHAPLFERALERVGGGRPLVVGDRLETDIAGAAALGWDTLLVLTGVTGEADLAASEIRPSYVGRDLSALGEDPQRIG